MFSLDIILSFFSTFFKENMVKIFYVVVALLLALCIYNQGKRNVYAEWDAANAKVAAKIAQDAADNKILAATIKGEHYAWNKDLDIEFNDANRLSADFSARFGEGATAGRTDSSTEGSGISTRRAEIAEERKRIVAEITAIRQRRNYLAREAKSNTKTLIDLQRFSKESK